MAGILLSRREIQEEHPPWSEFVIPSPVESVDTSKYVVLCVSAVVIGVLLLAPLDVAGDTVEDVVAKANAGGNTSSHCASV